MRSVRILPSPRTGGPPAPAVRLRAVADPAPPPEPVHSAERRLRDAGGPDDRATYACHCGCAFTAPVSTTVRCPLCADEQAW